MFVLVETISVLKGSVETKLNEKRVEAHVKEVTSPMTNRPLCLCCMPMSTSHCTDCKMKDSFSKKEARETIKTTKENIAISLLNLACSLPVLLMQMYKPTNCTGF